MILFYSQDRRPTDERQQFRNPRCFQAPEPMVSKVIIDGHWPKVEAAYLAAGAKVEVLRGKVAVPVVMQPPKSLIAVLAKRSKAVEPSVGGLKVKPAIIPADEHGAGDEPGEPA